MTTSTRLWSWLAPAAVLSTGCATQRVPLTAELRNQHQLGDDEVRRLQLYVSSDVKLRRELETRERSIQGGSLKLRTGKTIDEVVIAEKTPCVATNVSSHAITVEFDEGSTLTFSLTGREPARVSEPLRIEPRFAEPPGSERPKPLLVLDGSFDGSYWLHAEANHKIRFRGREWEAVGDTLRAHLLLSAEQLDDVEESRTVVRGRRL
jgi:hypothetical protein